MQRFLKFPDLYQYNRNRGIKEQYHIVLIMLSVLLYKIFSEIGYWFILSEDKEIYTSSFNAYKYVNGLIWILILVFFMGDSKNKIASFFLYFKILFEIVPITVIYGLGNDNPVYYNLLCFSFLVCELIVSARIKTEKIKTYNMAGIVYLVGLMSFILAIIYVVAKNKTPSLMALNIYNVYKLRASNSFQINKYINYLLQWSLYIIIPYCITKGLIKKKYLQVLFFSGIDILVYLYSGHKSYLFSLPLIFVLVLWGQRKEFIIEFSAFFSVGFSLLVVGSFYNELIYKIYSLIGRRVMIVSANNKFKYYDFFSKNPKLGIYGIFPQWLIESKSPYQKGIGYIISEIYYQKPEMNSNTGFLAEGYMRFGLIGIPLTLIIFALILRQINQLQKRTSYIFCMGVCIYSIFDLSDGYLWHSLFMGPWMFLIIVIFFYNSKRCYFIPPFKSTQ